MENVNEISEEASKFASAPPPRSSPPTTTVMETTTTSIDKGLDRLSEEYSEGSAPDKKAGNVEQSAPQTKTSGHLEKKGRMRMVSSWKKYWFVLEGRLLLYYRSRADYDTLSPCKGCITLGAPCHVKAGTTSNCVFQIETRNSTILLRADNRAEHDKWMQAILTALNHSSSHLLKLSQLCYSADDLAVQGQCKEGGNTSFTRQYTLPERMKKGPRKSTQNQNSNGTKAGISEIGGANKRSAKLPKNKALTKLVDKQESDYQEPSPELDNMKENELYAGTDSTITAINGQPSEESNVIVDNLHYVSIDETGMLDEQQQQQQEQERHIYQEITSKCFTQDTNEYAQLQDANVKDQNENKVQYCEPIYASNVIYATIGSNQCEPELPPRPKVPEDEAKSASTSNDIKKENAVHLKSLAKMVKQQRKEGAGKKPSFMIRMLKKMKRDDSSKLKVTTEYNEIYSASTNEAESVCGLVPNDQSNYLRSPVEQLVEELKEVLEEKKGVQTRDIGVVTSVEELPPIVFNYDGIELLESNDVQSSDHELITFSMTQNDQDLPLTTDGDVCTVAGCPQDAEWVSSHYTSLDHTTYLYPPTIPVSSSAQRQETHTEPLDADLTANAIKIVSKQRVESKLCNFECDFHDPTQRLYIPRPKLISKREKCSKQQNELMKIARILDDLENQNFTPFSRQKVKELNEQFDDHDTKTFLQEPNAVVAFGKELVGILDELTKANSAPLSSIINQVNENEGQELLPIRKRRLSEPDYDVPRPHSALQILPSAHCEDKMTPTRFFGPVFTHDSNDESKSRATSISPDSLEIDINFKLRSSLPGIEEDRSMRSYTSHIYASKYPLESTIDRSKNKEKENEPETSPEETVLNENVAGEGQRSICLDSLEPGVANIMRNE